MATLQAPEDGYDFVEKPSEDFFCPVTFDLLREPYLTPLSPLAVTTLQGQPCPVCKEPNLNPVHDKFFKRRVHELKVRCSNKNLGCEWVGELGDLDRHLSQSTVEGECQFVTVACPYSCGDGFQRCQLEGHKANDCPDRPFTCQYCGHEATYIAEASDHWAVCTKYPVYCPNKNLGCQWAGERGDLDQHLNDDYEDGECQFVTVACEQQLEEWEELDTRLIEELEERIKEQDSTIQKQRKTINQQQKQIVAIASALTQVAIALDVKKLIAPPVFVPPPDIVMTNFEMHEKTADKWYSPPFYSGYKMCLLVGINGCGDGEATLVAVFCCLNRGEYDDQLKWPFRGDITIQLLNQSRDDGHWEKTVPFDDRAGDSAERVVVKERVKGWGYDQFTARTQNRLS